MKRLAVYLILISPPLLGQDVIIKNDKSEINAKVLEILEGEIKYKKWDFIEGPVYSMRKNDIFMIIYQNGKREIFSEAVSTPVQPEPVRTETSLKKTPAVIVADPKPTDPERAAISNSGEFQENILPAPGSKYIFLPRDKSKPKGKDNFSEEFRAVTTDFRNIGSYPSMNGSIDKFIWPNFGLYNAYNMSFSWVFDYSSYSYNIGSSYAFNNLLKINKEKAVLFAGVYLAAGMSLTDIIAFSFGAGLRAGGAFYFTKNFGLIGEVHTVPGWGGESFRIGISRLIIRR